LKGQFKNPVPGNNPSTTPNNERLTGSVQPATPGGDQSQEQFAAADQVQPKRGASLVLPPWPIARSLSVRETPQPIEQDTLKQPGVRPSDQVPVYMQGQPGTYAPGFVPGQLSPSIPNPAQGMLQGPVGPQAFVPPQNPGVPFGARPATGALIGGPVVNQPSTGALAGGPGFPGFHQGPANVGSAFTGMNTNMVAEPPNIFNPNRPPVASGAIGAGSGDRGRRGRGDGPPPPSIRKKQKKKRRVPIWSRVVIGVLLLMIVALGSGYWYYEANYAHALSSIVGQQVQLAPGEQNPNAGRTGDILSGSRINILLLGSDTDEKFDGTYIAQTDIVLTIDPASGSVGMLSIPRDFYLDVPGAGMHKLDEAYGLGGVDLSRRTIEDDFGIPINYYAWIGLDGFIKVINEVGGVDVDVLHPIVDDDYPDDVGSNANNPYAVKRLYLAPGPQHLDGPTALEYVRSRHADLVGDFGRSVRQQQVLSALKTKLSNPDIFNKLSAIANDMTGYLKTDMLLPDVLKLMNFARSLDINKIAKLVLGPPYSSSGIAPAGSADAGADVVIPNCAKIVPAISQMLDLGSSAACNIDGNSSSSATSGVASTASQSTTPLADTLSSSSQASSTSLSTIVNSASATLGSGSSGLYGVSDLLDLLLLGVFESPDALQL
jgi:LCP family protein required for cell wall assembly